MKRKLLSTLLCLCLLFSAVIPGVASAETDPVSSTVSGETESSVSDEIIPAVNFTNVAPFLDPVIGQPVRRLMARAAVPAATNTDNGMVINKTAVANDDGTYTITLEAYATGEKVITEVSEDIPTDIVLVLDQSGSMANCIVCGNEIDGFYDYHYTYVATTSIDTGNTYYIKNGNTYTRVQYCDGQHNNRRCDGGAGWYTSNRSYDHTEANKITPKTSDDPNGDQFYKYDREDCSSRLSALKTAVTNFANAVAEKAAGKDGDITTTEDNINHRIAVVGFASESSYGNNTELLSISGTNSGSVGVAYNSITNQNLIDVVQNMNTAAGQTMVTNAINALAAEGATEVDLGMDMAERILNANPVKEGEQRNRVVIVFTDGAPTTFNGFGKKVATDAISIASEIKKAGTTVYSVGIFSGADPQSAGTEPSNDLNNDSKSIPAASNWFMQNLSSNNGKVQTPSYYLSAADAGTLNNIFQQISDQIESGGSSSTLTSEAVVKDIIAPAFALPAGATASDITLKTYHCTGKSGDAYTWSENSGDAMGATATVNGDQVSVTGFDFAANYVGTVTENGNTSYRGNKLVISFTVSLKAGFLGGNNVYTNAGAGVYENSDATQPVLRFPQPQVNVPIDNVAVTAADKNVYLLSDLTAEQLKSGAEVKCGDVTLSLAPNATNYGLESWQTEYVNITVTITDANGNEITSLNDLTDDASYTLAVTVAPKTDGTGADGTPATAKSDNETGIINVYKPTLTFGDSEVYYGADVPDFSSNLTNTVWKHGDTLAANVTMIGTAPTLSLTYTPEEDKIAGGKINTKQDIAVGVTVKINETDVTTHTTFQHTNCTDKVCTLPNGAEFLLHVKTCTLKITKEGGTDGEPYVFNIKKGNDQYTQATITGNGSVTICELPVGTYTIEEDTNWSWRYPNPTYTNNPVALSAQNSTGEITCTNNKDNNYWLNGFSQIVQNIFGGSTSSSTEGGK